MPVAVTQTLIYKWRMGVGEEVGNAEVKTVEWGGLVFLHPSFVLALQQGQGGHGVLFVEDGVDQGNALKGRLVQIQENLAISTEPVRFGL